MRTTRIETGRRSPLPTSNWRPAPALPHHTAFLLGQVGDGERRAIARMTPGDLATLGRVVTSGRLLVSDGMIGEFLPLFDSVLKVSSILKEVGIAPDPDFAAAADGAGELRGRFDEDRSLLDRSGDAVLDAVAGAIVSKDPDAQVSYRRRDGSIAVVAKGGGGPVSRTVSLDPPATDFVGVVKFIRSNSSVVDALKEGTAMAGLGNPARLMGIVGVLVVIVVIAAILWFVADRLGRSVQRSVVDKQIREREEAQRTDKSVLDDDEREIAALLKIPEPDRTPAQAARIQLLRDETKILRARIGSAEKTLEKLNEARKELAKEKDLVERLGELLENIATWVVVGVGAVVVLSVFFWIDPLGVRK